MDSSTSDFSYSLIDQNSNYYRKKWEHHKKPRLFSGWNWAAFFLAPFWAAARHMYGAAFCYFFIYLLFIAAESFLPALLNLGPEAQPSALLYLLPVILLHIVFGLFGNALYARKIYKQTLIERSGKPAAPLFRGTGRSKGAGILIPLLYLLLFAYPAFLTEAWTYNPELTAGVYVYDDEDQTPQGQMDVSESPSFEKYSARINLLYVGDTLEDRTLSYELYYFENGAWTAVSDRSFTFFSGNKLSLGLIDAEDPAVELGEYRVDLLLDDEVYDSQTFYITAGDGF